nr:GHKL domain-containing protein [uncultured Oscillibacter sp.]
MSLQYQHLIDLTTAICMFVVVFIFLILFEPRCPKKIYYVSLVSFMALWLGGNLYILLVHGLEVQEKYTLFTTTLPSLIYFWIVAKNRGGRFFFTFCMVDTVMIWVMMVTGLIDHAAGGEGFVTCVLRLAAFPIMLAAAWRFARKPYLALLNTVSRGWWLFSAMTGLFYVSLTIVGGFPTSLRSRPDAVPAAVMMLILLPLTYATIFIVLHQQDKLFRTQERQRVFEAQAVMMSHRIEDIRRAEDAMRIERHDMRHQLQTVASLAQKGDTAALLDYIGKSQEKLDSIAPKRYCSHPILDAVLTNAATQAEQMGISLEITVALPEELPVDALELSIVFANALENAIQAVRNLPDGQRLIVCKSVVYPRFIIEISNPYAGKVSFDQRGFPITDKPGHGVGTRSIVAFAEKYHALCLFRAEGDWFKMQIAV